MANSVNPDQTLRSVSTLFAQAYLSENFRLHSLSAGLHSSVASVSDCKSRGGGLKFESQLGHTIFVEIDHEIIVTVILSLLIQEGQLSFTGEGMSISTV